MHNSCKIKVQSSWSRAIDHIIAILGVSVVPRKPYISINLRQTPLHMYGQALKACGPRPLTTLQQGESLFLYKSNICRFNLLYFWKLS